MENLFYLPTSERYNPSGNPEGIASDSTTDGSTAPCSRPCSPSISSSGEAPASATAGSNYDYHYNITNFTLAYGITDRLLVGFESPYYVVHNDVTASVNSDPGSSANVGCDRPRSWPAVRVRRAGVTAVMPEHPAIHDGGRQPATRRGSSGNPRVRLQAHPGLLRQRHRDFLLGEKYQYWRSEDVRLAASGGVRFPTGRQDDANDLVDMSWSGRLGPASPTPAGLFPEQPVEGTPDVGARSASRTRAT